MGNDCLIIRRKNADSGTKSYFFCSFWHPIGTCLFKILIPDEELLILKGGNYSSIGTTTLIQKLRPML